MYDAIFKPVFMCTLLHLYSEEIYCFHCFLKKNPEMVQVYNLNVASISNLNYQGSTF